MASQSSDLQARIDAVAWYHEFDFGNGLQARSTQPDAKLHRRIWRFIEARLGPVDFGGRSVVDVGAWDGQWSFYAERRGAASVLATDDLSQNWSDGSGIHLAKELFGSAVEIRQDVSVHQLDRLGRTFDIVLCLGVYYHLIDPFHAFAQLRHLCHSDSVLVLEGDVAILDARPDSAFYPFAGSGAQAFVPTARTLDRLLEAAYFEVRSRAWLHPALLRRAATWRQRVRGTPPPLTVDRAVTVCAPVQGTNPRHPYRPPFGLAAYDDRFAG